MEENPMDKTSQKRVEEVRKNYATPGNEAQAQQPPQSNSHYPSYYDYYGQPQASRQPMPGPGGSGMMTCPTCGKPGYYYPYETKKGLKDKKFLKIPIVIWIVVLFAAVLFSCVIIAFISFPIYESNKEVFNEEVIIANGGHFRYSLGYNINKEIILNISSRNGNNFDVYIMDEDQYENAYGSTNSQIISFSSYYSNENTNSVSDNLDFRDANSRYIEYFLIIDNRDTRITPDDATPFGTITIDVKITIETSYYSD